MKKKLIFVVFLFALTSCKKFLDVNDNPNEPTIVPPKIILPNTTIGLGWANGSDLGRVSSILMQYNAGVSNALLIYDNYNLAGSFDIQWDYDVYSRTASNLKILIRDNQEKNPAYAGIGKIQLAYILSIATDLWGDVPYSEAGIGTVIRTPRYDKQEDIYQGNQALGITSLFDLVKSGITDLDQPSVLKPGLDDLVFKGDIGSWKRVANSLLLKFAITISNVNKPLATKIAAEVSTNANGLIDDPKYDLAIPFASSVNNQNPMYAYDIAGNFRNNEMLSSRLLVLSKSLNDTVRLSKMYTKPAGKFSAFENGSTGPVPAIGVRSIYNTYIIGNSGEAPVRLLTTYQTRFNQAEAAVALGVNSANADVYFKQGIRASMSSTGMTTDQINDYFATNPATVTLSGTTANKIKQIITQKYLSWVGNGIEAYNDYRRTGYPVLALALNVTGGDDPSVIPKRLPYTSNEGNSNPNQPKPRPKTNEKVWWGL